MFTIGNILLVYFEKKAKSTFIKVKIQLCGKA